MRNRLLLVGPLPKVVSGGVSLGFESLLQGVAEAGYDYRVVDSLWGGSQKVNGRFTLMRALATLVVVLRVWGHLPVCGKVYMTISSSKAGFIKDCLIIWAAWLLRRRMTCHLKGGGYGLFYASCTPSLQWLVRITLNRATRIIVLGELLREQFNFVKDADRRINVVPNGLTIGLGERKEPKHLPGRDKPFRVLYLSNMIPSKGFVDLLVACHILHNRGILFRCDFCGSFVQTIEDADSAGWNSARFQEQIFDFGLDAHVTFHGTVRGKEKENFLEHAHCLVLPTAYPWEGQPISIIEALAYATPVISSRHRGIPEQVIDGENGFLVPFGEPESIADLLQHLAQESSVFDRCSKKALNLFRQKFTREQHLANLLKVITGEFRESVGDDLLRPNRG